MLNTARATIDLAALRHNLGVVRGLCPASRIMAMVKADAYGHGLLQAAAALRDVDGFAVARLREALELRRAGITQRILLLGTLLDAADLRLCAAEDIDVTVHDPAGARLAADSAARYPLRVWLELDSGMHRLGLSPEEFRATEQHLRNAAGIRELLHLTHFSAAEDRASAATDRQLSVLRSLRAETTEEHAASLANSAALIGRPDTRMQWVRPGIMLYGVNPLGAEQPLPLRPVMTLRSTVLALRTVRRGEAVGYNGIWSAERDSLIATIGIGYGDGYPRHARSGTPVAINGELAPLVGRVSMDSITVDITGLNAIEVGDEATLWGDSPSAALVASHADTISYELFTSLSGRVTREYVGLAESTR